MGEGRILFECGRGNHYDLVGRLIDARSHEVAETVAMGDFTRTSSLIALESVLLNLAPGGGE